MGKGTDPAAETEAAPLPNTSIPVLTGPELVADRYEILGMLGAGAMGTVYRARDRELDEIVALKMLRRELAAAPGMIERFRREVKLARRVTHKNVARMFDIGDHAGERFLTMEFIEGEMLGARLARLGRLGVGEAFAIGADVCAGLAAAHAAGVLHRDLKPENVIVGKDGRAVITDFGIARALAEVEAARTGGGLVGTPAYMAPEQVEGAHDLDGRTDLYALGAMLYELLTGAMPWPGDTIIAIAAARLLRPPPDPRQVTPEISAEAAAIVGELMARRREERVGSAEEARSRLVAIASATDPSAYDKPVARKSFARAARSAQRTVAVLPLLVAATEDEYLAGGVGDDLLDALTAVRDLRVRAVPPTPEHMSRARDARAIGRELGVDVVVDGSVRRAGELVRVAVRVVTVADGFQLWAHRWERRLEQVLSVADEAAAEIARALTAASSPRAGVAQANDPRAQDLFLRARYAMSRAWWWDNAEEVLDLLAQASALAPDDARIHGTNAVALARSYVNDLTARATPKLARDAAARALGLQPEQPEALTAIGLLHLGDGEGAAAIAELKRAVRFAPGAVDALDALGRMLVEIGRKDDGVEYLKRIYTRDPFHRAGYFSHARVLALAGDFDGALEMIGERPRGAHDLVPYLVFRARIILWSLDRPRAQAMLDELPKGPMAASRQIQPVREMLEVVRRRTMTDALRSEMDVSLPLARHRTARRACFNAQVRAELQCAAGEWDDALASLRAADAATLPDIEWLNHCPLLAPLRARPEYDPIHANVQARARRVSDAYDET